jgi:hypothetical protein
MAPISRDLVLAGLHTLLAELHYSLAINKMPSEKVIVLTESLVNWYDGTRQNDSQ